MSISDQFRGLPMGDLIGSPLKAAAISHESAKEIADFVKVAAVRPLPITPITASTEDEATVDVVMEAKD